MEAMGRPNVSFLSDARQTRPILMPDTSEKGRNLRFLMEFQGKENFDSRCAGRDDSRTVC